MVKKAVRAKPKRAGKKKPTKQEFRKRIRGNFQAKLRQALKLQRQLEKQKLHPDEVASRVGKHVDKLSDGVASDMLRYLRGSIFN